MAAYYKSFIQMGRGVDQIIPKPNEFYNVEFASIIVQINVGKDKLFYDHGASILVVPPFPEKDQSRCFHVTFSAQTNPDIIQKREDSVRLFVHTVSGHQRHPQTEPDPYNAQGVIYGGPYFYGFTGPYPNVGKSGLLPQTTLQTSSILSVPHTGDYIVAQIQAQQLKASTKDYYKKHIYNAVLTVWELDRIQND